MHKLKFFPGPVLLGWRSRRVAGRDTGRASTSNQDHY
jgi:hypothetical protein